MSSRLKILLMPPGRGVVPPFDQHSPEEAAHMSPVIMAGVWEDRKADHAFHGRLRSEQHASLPESTGMNRLNPCDRVVSSSCQLCTSHL